MKIYNDKEITNNTNYPDLFKLFKVIATTYIKLYVFNDKLWMLYYLNKHSNTLANTCRHTQTLTILHEAL